MLVACLYLIVKNYTSIRFNLNSTAPRGVVKSGPDEGGRRRRLMSRRRLKQWNAWIGGARNKWLLLQFSRCGQEGEEKSRGQKRKEMLDITVTFFVHLSTLVYSCIRRRGRFNSNFQSIWMRIDPFARVGGGETLHVFRWQQHLLRLEGTKLAEIDDLMARK